MWANCYNIYGFTEFADLRPSLPLLGGDPLTRIYESSYRRLWSKASVPPLWAQCESEKTARLPMPMLLRWYTTPVYHKVAAPLCGMNECDSQHG